MNAEKILGNTSSSTFGLKKTNKSFANIQMVEH